MGTIYPAGIDTSANLPVAIDNVTAANANVINTLRGAILAIEHALGVNPAGIYTTVRTRLDTLEALITGGGGGGFVAGGDLIGNAINQKVISLTGDGTNPIIINNSTLQFAPTLGGGNVFINQAKAVSGQGGIMWIQSQSAATGSNFNGGALVFQSGAGDGTGICGGVVLATADATSNIILTHGANISMTGILTLSNYISSPYLYTDGTGVVHAGTAPPGSSFVYREGGTVGGNVFVNFADAVAAANALNGATTFIYVDSSLGAPIVPLGSYDLTNISLVGKITSGSLPTLTFQDGAILTNIWSNLYNIIVDTVSSSTVFTVPSLFILNGFNSQITASGGTPFFASTGTISMKMTGNNFVFGDGVNHTMSLASFTSSSMYVGPDCTISSASFSPLGGNFTVFNANIASFIAPNIGTSFNLTYVPAGLIIGYMLCGNGNPSTVNLDNAHLQAIVDTSAGATVVNAPDSSPGGAYIQQVFRVTDDAGNAATHNITVNSEQLLEDPATGSFLNTVIISTNGASIDWQFTGTHYKII